MADAFANFLKETGMKEEYDEVELDTSAKTGYPVPVKKFRLILTEHEESLEGMYYWFHEAYKQDGGYNEFIKIIDTFAASEQSSFFGVSQQRLGLQQDKVSQFLASIGKMVKEMFQFVRELRIIDERIQLYLDSFSSNLKKAESADIALKGVWIDLVEGGSKNPGSVYGLAREVGFTILPDLFFATRYTTKGKLDKDISKMEKEDITAMEKLCQEEIDEIDSFIDNGTGESSIAKQFNRKVVEVLKRKMKTYHMWKKLTFKELWVRRRFTLQYFRQHFEVIRLYMAWIKPYMRNVRRLQLKEEFMDSAELVGAFEGSMVEVEVLATKPMEQRNGEPGKYYACGLFNIKYRTRAAMSYQQEGYNRGPKHSGRATITLRAYAWNRSQIDAYKKMRQAEDFELLTVLDNSLKMAIDALKDDMLKYLGEAGEEIYKKDKQKEEDDEKAAVKKAKEERNSKKVPMSDSIKNTLDDLGMGDGFKGVIDIFKSKPKGSDDDSKGRAEKDASGTTFRAFKFYRKAHRLLTY
jgi:hypothetical protein